MSNGKMKLLENGTITGEIRTMRLNFTFRLQKIMDRRSDKAPDYTIVARSPYGGHECEVGKAWERTINRGDSAGQTMFSLSFDDPDFGDNPVYATAFPAQDGYEVTIERKRGGNTASPTDAAEQKAAA